MNRNRHLLPSYAWAFLFVGLSAAAAWAAPDTLVVCPDEFRAALTPWENHRREQGHVLAIITPTSTASELCAKIRQAANAGQLKYVVLVGDVSDVPTGYIDAQINVRWGSEPSIATDQLYADVDNDGSPDIAVGRIPADTPQELTAFVQKLLRYEQQADTGSWRRRIDVVAGVGGFGPITDMLIESAGRSVFQQVVPASYEVRQLPVNPDRTCQQISAGSFAWIYLGHGLPTMLDNANTPTGPRSILSTDDVPRLRCAANSPLAVLIACYTGAIDARTDCLAEELALYESGPVAVVAATRVSMPYGNAVLGCELLRAGVAHQAATLGDMWLVAKQKSLEPAAAADTLRTSLDALARGVSPPPVDLDAERHEHVMMYQLLGDPLTKLNYPVAAPQVPARIATTPGERLVK